MKPRDAAAVLFWQWLIGCYLFTVESVYTLVYTRDQRRSVGIGEADRDPQNIWNPGKNYGSFVDATSSEP